ncbi:MAG: type I-E CRISPR-associated protein Cas7/Cse4/CasC [Persicimonas sp.]
MMTTPKFLQIHTLTSYPATLLNRDDAGFAKRLPFGGATRTRVSSQCLKYHWRHFEGENALYDMDVPKSYRSRRTFNQLVIDPLVDQGYPRPLTRAAVFALQQRVLNGKKAGKTDTKKLLQPGEDDDPAEMLETGQITIFGEPELRYLRELAAERLDEIREDYPHLWSDEGTQFGEEFDDVVERVRDFSKGDLKKALTGLELATGLDAAMFGRMATSDVLARGDAAVHVAHALTTHAQETESDYFLAADELKSDTGELGGGHINSAELTSGLFYSYQVIDVPLLVSNLTGKSRDDWQDAERDLAAEVVRRMIHLVTTVSPGAKLGSTAPYSRAQALLVEAGTSQPRTLANAFQTPASRENVLEDSYRKLGRYVSQMDGMYGVDTERRLAAMGDTAGLADAVKAGELRSVPEIADWASNLIRE